MNQEEKTTPDQVGLLAARDERLAPLLYAVLERVGGIHALVGTHKRAPLEALLRAVVGQQLSGAAAATIFARLVGQLPGRRVEAGQVLALPDSALRGAGLSASKARFVRNICAAVGSQQLDLQGLQALDDERVAASLQAISGVGEWTASMYLIFHLERPDVLPCADVGIQRGLQLAYGLGRRPSADYVRRAGEKWRPHRTLVCRFLWTALNEKVSREHVKRHAR